MSTQLHHFADGAEIRVVSDTFHDLSTLARRNAELEQANRQLELDVQRLERLVYLDPLTGLGNRRHFDVVIASVQKDSEDAANFRRIRSRVSRPPEAETSPAPVPAPVPGRTQ